MAAFIGVKDVAGRYSVRDCTVYEWIRTGAIPYRRLPGRKQIMFSVEDLDLFDSGCCELVRTNVKGKVEDKVKIGVIVRPKVTA
jgi:hypothetical protein